MKDNFKLMLIALAMSITTVACTGNRDNSASGAKPPHDSVKSGSDTHTDSASAGLGSANDTSKTKDTSSKN